MANVKVVVQDGKDLLSSGSCLGCAKPATLRITAGGDLSFSTPLCDWCARQVENGLREVREEQGLRHLRLGDYPLRDLRGLLYTAELAGGEDCKKAIFIRRAIKEKEKQDDQ